MNELTVFTKYEEEDLQKSEYFQTIFSVGTNWETKRTKFYPGASTNLTAVYSKYSHSTHSSIRPEITKFT